MALCAFTKTPGKLHKRRDDIAKSATHLKRKKDFPIAPPALGMLAKAPPPPVANWPNRNGSINQGVINLGGKDERLARQRRAEPGNPSKGFSLSAYFFLSFKIIFKK